MDVVIFTPVPLLGESLAACLSGHDGIVIAAVCSAWDALDGHLRHAPVDLIVVDVTQGLDLRQMRAFVAQWPRQLFLALGLREQRQEVVNCGKAGFAGYVARDASIEKLRRAIVDVVDGRLACPQDIAGELMRALYRVDLPSSRVDADRGACTDELTRREYEVAQLIGRGCSNKEIARELTVSLATVKHHVHNILTKLQLPTRSMVARAVRESPWGLPSIRGTASY